ncbi:MAG: tRNA (adenosine(37)-N6)-threonylcarbamoyltransferase complex ATPase subunit type 1 TsaE [Burkholderiales bacterium]|nr:tRNA (adenosine(37)-N6)-threonylcarbamoyltransferase complex ATPase subunit type 1 TsaE [Burkholderiales bacterium]
MSYKKYLPDEAATGILAARLAPFIEPGLCVFLKGDLGAGKTTFARALIQALGYEGRVKSPTYALVELYKLSSVCLYHFDFYRFHDPQEWIDAGFRECFNDENVCLVEWPEKAGGLLPSADLTICLSHAPPGRNVEIRASTPMGERCLARLS